MEQQFNFNNELTGKIALVTGSTKGKSNCRTLTTSWCNSYYYGKKPTRKQQRKSAFHFGGFEPLFRNSKSSN